MVVTEQFAEYAFGKIMQSVMHINGSALRLEQEVQNVCFAEGDIQNRRTESQQNNQIKLQ
jgi:hypothetical protein